MISETPQVNVLYLKFGNFNIVIIGNKKMGHADLTCYITMQAHVARYTR